MNRMTSKQLQTLVEKCPSWAIQLNEPVRISDYCRMFESPISHLSPYLHFIGRDEFGKCADFVMCENLIVAEGFFGGEVDFSYSSIAKIGNLTIKKAGKSGNAADFTSCHNLRVATGNFPGAVTFKGSAIQRVENLHIQSPNKEGMAAEFYFCDRLRHAEGYYPGHVCYSNSGVQRIGELNAISADFSMCEELRDASSPARWLDNPNVSMDRETRSRLEAIRNL